MPDIKLGTSTFNDINVLQMYDVNNKICNFYYNSYVGPQCSINFKVLGLEKLFIEPKIDDVFKNSIVLKLEVVK